MRTSRLEISCRLDCNSTKLDSDLCHTESIKIRVNTLRCRKHGKVAIIICLEDIQALVNGKGLKFGVVATNIFEEAEAKWFLTHHHGSLLSNYFGPNSEIF